MRDRKTSRILNDDSFFLGLSYSDISGSGVFLLVIFIILKAIGIQNMFWAFMATLFALSVLIPIRMGFRRKIIRDSFYYLINNGVIHVSKNYRHK